MGTDGSGRKVNLPSFMITGHYFKTLAECIKGFDGLYNVDLTSSIVSPTTSPGFAMDGSSDQEWNIRTMTNARFTVKKENNLFKLMLTE